MKEKRVIIFLNTLIVISAYLLLSGCSTLKEAPLESIMEEPKKYSFQKVYYYTNREPARIGTALFTDRRALDYKAYYGMVIVNIPKNRKVGELPILISNKDYTKEDLDNYFLLMGHRKLNQDEKSFYNEIRYNLKEGGIFLFIHGYKNTFLDSVFRTAQLIADMDTDKEIIPMTFSWPSGRTDSYFADEENIKYSIPFLKEYLLDIRKKYPNVPINIVAHSMGTRLLTNTLKEISLTKKEEIVFDNIILASADIDSDVFKYNLLQYIKPISKQYHIYASAKDKALLASKKIHKYPRVGKDIPSICDIFEKKKVEIVDTSSTENGFFNRLLRANHADYAQNKAMIRDMRESFYNGNNVFRIKNSQEECEFYKLYKF